ncbi:MAG: hypothetical protein IJO88_04635 [Oscillospiraceae bacterium]|nr:hypothetical protein [Oscillospiraceae bacterium]
MKYLAIILFCKLLQPLLNKKCSMELSGTRMFMRYMLIRQFAAAAIALVLCGGMVQAERAMLLIAMAFALCLTVCTYAGIAAMQSSAMVLVSMFEMAGLLVPCVVGIFLFSEPLKLAHIIGLMACIVSAWLLTGESRTSKERLPIKAWLLLAACLLSNGGIMLTQKLFAVAVPNGDIGAFHFWGFLFSAVFSAIILLSAGKEKEASKITPKLGIYGVILSAALLTISMLSTRVSASVPSVILFSAVNGGGLLLCTIVSAFVYKEKLTVRMVAGLVIGAAALMLINLA